MRELKGENALLEALSDGDLCTRLEGYNKLRATVSVDAALSYADKLEGVKHAG